MTTATKSSDLLPPVFAIGANGLREAGRPVRGGEIRPDSLMQLDRVQNLQNILVRIPLPRHADPQQQLTK